MVLLPWGFLLSEAARSLLVSAGLAGDRRSDVPFGSHVTWHVPCSVVHGLDPDRPCDRKSEEFSEQNTLKNSYLFEHERVKNNEREKLGETYGPGFSSLVVTGHNSTTSTDHAHEREGVVFGSKIEVCPDAGWLLGECKHGTKRWVILSCKRRTCPVCGELRKHRISWRIQLGIEQLGGERGGAWFTGTFGFSIKKKAAVKVVAKFVRWVRGRMCFVVEGADGVKRTVIGYHAEYCSTWEVQKNGDLHVNIIFAPWSYIPQRELSAAWRRFGGGPVVWIKRVGAGIGHEVAKDRKRIGNYVAKWDQMVLQGRGVTYSKGWPKLPSDARVQRQGEIDWRWVGSKSFEDTIFNYEREQGHWLEMGPGEYGSAYGEECDCFKLKSEVKKTPGHVGPGGFFRVADPLRGGGP